MAQVPTNVTGQHEWSSVFQTTPLRALYSNDTPKSHESKDGRVVNLCMFIDNFA